MIKLNTTTVKQAMNDKGWNESRFALEMKLKAQQLKLPNVPGSYMSYVHKVLRGDFVPKMDRMILMAETLGIKRKSIWSNGEV
jgi:hypothetical protein